MPKSTQSRKDWKKINLNFEFRNSWNTHPETNDCHNTDHSNFHYYMAANNANPHDDYQNDNRVDYCIYKL